MMRRWGALALLLLSVPARAADTPSQPSDPAAGAAPMPVFPTSPAFDALGANPTEVMRPSSPREFGSDVVSTLGPDGRFKTGIAIETAPFWLIWGKAVTLKAWRDSFSNRMLSRFTLSIATTAQAQDGVTGLAEGLKFVLWDESDPRFDQKLESCISKALNPDSKPTPPQTAPQNPDNKPTPPPDAESAGALPDTRVSDNPKLGSCIMDSQHRHTGNGSGFAIAGALTQEATGGDPGSTSVHKANAWAALALGIGGSDANNHADAWGQFVASSKYSFDRSKKEHDLAAGIKLRLGTSDLGFAIDWSWTPHWLDGQSLPKSFVLGTVAELRVASATWVSVTSGGRFGSDEPLPGLFTLANLKFALASQASVSPAPSPL
jgi:hypothetical protein